MCKTFEKLTGKRTKGNKGLLKGLTKMYVDANKKSCIVSVPVEILEVDPSYQTEVRTERDLRYDFCILSKAFIPKEVMEIEDYTIIDFDGETSQYNGGNGVLANDEWFGRVLHGLGYINFPFVYTEEMEDYVIWDQLWYTANSEGWVDIRYNGKTYLVKKW